MDSLYDGESVQCLIASDGIAELHFNNKKSSVNKFDQETLSDLSSAVKSLQSQQERLKGVLVLSKKDVFIVGADITEFLGLFAEDRTQIKSWLQTTHDLFNSIEDLGVPSVCAINGICLGGGFELALATTYRIMSTTAVVGLPETKLGIIPGWGGDGKTSKVNWCR